MTKRPRDSGNSRKYEGVFLFGLLITKENHVADNYNSLYSKKSKSACL